MFGEFQLKPFKYIWFVYQAALQMVEAFDANYMN